MFLENKEYKRSTLHDQHGGNRQSGIAPSSREPIIFVFSGKSGNQHGYFDGWDANMVYTYTGEGQKGDMKFTSGNKALRDHLSNFKQVYLFEQTRKGYVNFISELELIDWSYSKGIDTDGKTRKTIKFYFKKAGKELDLTFQNKLEDPIAIYETKAPTTTERLGLVTSRVGQGWYRKNLLERWNYKCAVSGCSIQEILIASHIKPWKDSSVEERLDVENGLILSPVYDALFDKNFISFDRGGEIIVSNLLSKDHLRSLRVTGNERILGLSSKNCEYLIVHRSMLK